MLIDILKDHNLKMEASIGKEYCISRGSPMGKMSNV